MLHLLEVSLSYFSFLPPCNLFQFILFKNLWTLYTSDFFSSAIECHKRIGLDLTMKYEKNVARWKGFHISIRICNFHYTLMFINRISWHFRIIFYIIIIHNTILHTWHTKKSVHQFKHFLFGTSGQTLLWYGWHFTLRLCSHFTQLWHLEWGIIPRFLCLHTCLVGWIHVLFWMEIHGTSC